MNNSLMTIKDIAEYLQVKDRTVYSWINKGIIPHYKIESLIRFKENEINEWLSSKEVSV